MLCLCVPGHNGGIFFFRFARIKTSPSDDVLERAFTDRQTDRKCKSKREGGRKNVTQKFFRCNWYFLNEEFRESSTAMIVMPLYMVGPASAPKSEAPSGEEW